MVNLEGKQTPLSILFASLALYVVGGDGNTIAAQIMLSTLLRSASCSMLSPGDVTSLTTG